MILNTEFYRHLKFVSNKILNGIKIIKIVCASVCAHRLYMGYIILYVQ